MSDNIDMEIESLLRHKILILNSIGIESPISVEADYHEQMSFAHRLMYTVHGNISGREWLSVFRTWDDIIDDAKAATWPRELDEQTRETLLSL